MDLERHGWDPGIRASDAERDRVGSLLNRHYADGRLSYDDFSERISAVYQAQTRGELRYALRELPVLTSPAPAPSTSEPARRGARPLTVAVTLVLAALAVLLSLALIVGAVGGVRAGQVSGPAPGPPPVAPPPPGLPQPPG